MSGKKDKNFYDEEEEDKKCPPNRHVSRSNPNEEHKRGGASLVYKEDREDTKRAPGPDNEGRDEDEDQMAFVSREELIIPILAEAEHFNTEDEEKRRHAPNIGCPLGIYRTNEPYWPDADVVPDSRGRRRKLVGAFLLVITIATVIGAVLGMKLREDETLSPSAYEETQPPSDEEILAPSRYEALSLLLANVSYDGGDALRNSSTPQYEAFNWTFTNSSDLAAFSNEQIDERIIQRYALATIFFSTNGNSWNYKKGWLIDPDECTWYGVECTSSGAVSELDLHDNDEGNNLHGPLPPEVGLLSYLAYLNLANNILTGTIPFVIGKLSDSLEYFILAGNALEGMIPSEVGRLTKLASLALLNNTLTGMLPSEIGMLSDSLEYLWLGLNALEGTIPSDVGQLAKLTSLWLYSNQLTGTIPSEIGMLSDSLQGLSFWNNALEGTVPTEIGQLTTLAALILFNNTLTGTIPSEIDSLVNLAALYLYGNNFTGNYTCPKSMEECAISCDDEYTDACRSL